MKTDLSMNNFTNLEHIESKLYRKKQLFQGLELYWIVPIFIGIYGLLGEPNTEGFIFPVFCASVASGLALWSAKYYSLSFVSICVIIHAINYPIGAILNLMLPETAVYETFLWDATPLAMWACSLGMIGFAIGARLPFTKIQIIWSKSLGKLRDINLKRKTFGAANMPRYITVLLTLVLVLVVLFKISKDIYFHSQTTGIDFFNFENARKYASLDYIVLLSYTGIVFQIKRYVNTHNRIDGLWALFLFIFATMVFAPSGSRDATFRAIVISFPIYWALENRRRIKYLVLGTGVILLLFLVFSLQVYRHAARESGDAGTLHEKTKVLYNSMTSMKLSDILAGDEAQFMYARRFADYVATGWYISTIPRDAPFRYLENIQYWPFLLSPVFVRPQIPSAALQEGAALTYESSGYGWHKEGEGSSPSMILGDLYSRFGWPGIFVGMFILGILLKSLDYYFRNDSMQKSILFVMLWLSGWTLLTQGSITDIFIFFTRTFFISWIIAYIASYFISRFVKLMKRTRFV